MIEMSLSDTFDLYGGMKTTAAYGSQRAKSDEMLSTKRLEVWHNPQPSLSLQLRLQGVEFVELPSEASWAKSVY